MGYGNSYTSSKTNGGSPKSSTYESSKVTSPKANGYDSSKVSSSSATKATSAKGELGDIKRLLVRYLDICQEIENQEAALESLKTKRDELRAKIALHPQASTISSILSSSKNSKR